MTLNTFDICDLYSIHFFYQLQMLLKKGSMLYIFKHIVQLSLIVLACL